MFNNFERIKIVKFKNGSYALRKGIFIFRYLCLRGSNKDMWISKENAEIFRNLAQTTRLDEIVRALKSYTDYRTFKKDNGRILSEDEIFFTDLKKKQEFDNTTANTASGYASSAPFTPATSIGRSTWVAPGPEDSDIPF